MKIIGIVPIPKEGEPSEFIVNITEDELDIISGIAKKTHISGRYKVGNQIKCAATYDRLEAIGKGMAQLPAKVAAIRQLADELETFVEIEE